MNGVPQAFVVTCSDERLSQFRETFSAASLDGLDVSEWRGCVIPGEGSLGNAVAQYSLVRHALESGLDSLLVFEDDAVPSDDAKYLLPKELESARARGDGVVRLGWTYLPSELVDDPNAPVKHLYGSHAYAILTRDAMKAYLEAWPKQGRADCVFDHMDGIRVGRSEKCLFAQLTPPESVAGAGIHHPAGWSYDADLARINGELRERYSETVKVFEKRRAERTIHVAYTVDVQGQGAGQFCDQLFASIFSLKTTLDAGEMMKVHVFYGNMPANVVSKLHRLQNPEFVIDIRPIDPKDLKYMQGLTNNDPKAPVRTWGGIVFARLWLPFAIKNADRCIYLDADTLVRKSLRPLWDTDLKGNLLGMNWGSVYEYGYNSGVMLMDLKAMRDDKAMFGRLSEFLDKNAKKFYCPDQTAINLFFAKRILPIGREWNFPPTRGNMDPKMNDAAIWHWYNGGGKPVRIDSDDFGSSALKWNEVLKAGERSIK